MPDQIVVEFEELTGLKIEQVINGEERSPSLQALTDQFLAFFPEQPHVVGELESTWHESWPDDQVIVHAWLLRVGGKPAGLTVFHTNLRRQVITQHYLGLEPEAGKLLPLRWVLHLVNAIRDVGARDCEAAGTILLGQIGENQVAHARAWERFGYLTLDVDYLEPDHGRSWPENGGPNYHPMTLQLRLTDAGRDLPLGEVVQRGLRAYLLDHYCVPENEPTVQNSLNKAAALS